MGPPVLKRWTIVPDLSRFRNRKMLLTGSRLGMPNSQFSALGLNRDTYRRCASERLTRSGIVSSLETEKLLGKGRIIVVSAWFNALTTLANVGLHVIFSFLVILLVLSLNTKWNSSDCYLDVSIQLWENLKNFHQICLQLDHPINNTHFKRKNFDQRITTIKK